MYRFSEVTYNLASNTADIGAGLIWDDVYAALAPYNVNVVGGRVTGVGVAGFILGGGEESSNLKIRHNPLMLHNRLFVENQPTWARY